MEADWDDDSLPHQAWAYAKAIFRKWLVLVTGGILAAGMGVWEHVTGQALPKGSYGLLLGTAMLMAGFLAWREERRLTIAERRRRAVENLKAREELALESAKNARAEIVGRVTSFSTSRTGTFTGAISKSCSATIQFVMEVRNMRPTGTNLDRVRISGSALPIPADFENVDAWRLMPITHSGSIYNVPPSDRHPELSPGIFMQIAGSAEMTVEGFWWEELNETLSLRGLMVEFVDGFGNAHLITVDDDATISVDSQGRSAII